MPDGKIVDHFMFRRHGQAFKVPVRLSKGSEHYEGPGSSRYAGPQQTSRAVFGVQLDKPKLNFWSTDIEALRLAVLDKLADHYKIEWTEYLIVEVSEGYTSYDDDGTSVELSWRAVYVGKTPDGEVVHQMSRSFGPAGADFQKGWPDVRVSKMRGSRRKNSVALVKSTEANIKALEEFRDRLNTLRKKLMDFLSPKKIAASLDEISGLLPLALPPPKAKEAPKEVAVEDMTIHTPEVTTKSPRKKSKKRKNPLPKVTKPRKMRRCKDA